MFPEPITVPLLGVTLRVHNALVLAAVVVGSVLVLVTARRLEGLSGRRTLAAIALITCSEFFFGRLHYVLAHWDPSQSSLLSVLRLWGSIHAAGAVVGVVIGAVLAGRLLGVAVGKLADACVPGAGVAIALARLGCFAHGCCFGAVCTLPWCFRWRRGTPVHGYQATQQLIGDVDRFSLPVHPLQLYFAAVGLGIAVVATVLYRRKRYDGQVALGALAAFALTTLALEPLRAFPPESYWGPMSPLMWAASALLLAASGTILAARATRRRRSGHRPATLPAAVDARP